MENMRSIADWELEGGCRNSKPAVERKKVTTHRCGKQVAKTLVWPSVDGILSTVEKM